MIDEHTSTPHHGSAPAAESDATPQPPSSPTSFWHLPYELRHLIILTACGQPVLPRHTTVGRSTECTTTMLALLQTARVFYTVIIPLLYGHVRLSRPSTLRSFQQTISGRPSLGRLVKALHIGPDEPLPSDWFPMRPNSDGTAGYELFTLNIGGSWEAKGSWVHSQKFEHDLKEAGKSGAAGRALFHALLAAARDLDVNTQDQYGLSGHWLSSNRWVVRILELQAALELYYFKFQDPQRHQGGKGSQKDVQASYVRLKVVPSSTSSPVEEGDEVFYITRAEIYERMASAGAPTDSFSNPFLFARSGLTWITQGPDGTTYEGHGLVEEEVEMELESLLKTHPSGLSTNEENNTATVVGNLALASCVLSLTPHVRSLSLTGFFDKAVAGERAPSFQLSALQSLTLGPVPAQWGVPLRLDHSALCGIKKLRLCGGWLLEQEIACITGKDCALPQLSTFHWSMPEQCDHEAPDDVVTAIGRLLGVQVAQLGETKTVASFSPKKRRISHEVEVTKLASHDQEDDRDLGMRPRPVNIEAHLHPRSIEQVLEAAPTKEAVEALNTGSELPGTPNRLKLVEHATHACYPDPTWADPQAMQGLYEQGRRWWEGEL